MLRLRALSAAITAELLLSGLPLLAAPAAAAVASATLTSSTGNNLDGFGNAVATSGDVVVVGAPHHDAGADVNSDEGAVYVYQRGATGWTSGTELAVLTASDAAPGQQLGWAVAISGDVIAATAIKGNGGAGAIYVFVKPAGGWTSMTESAYLRSSTGDLLALGASLAIIGDTIFAGAPSHDTSAGSDAGALLMFDKPAGGWGPRSAGDITESMFISPSSLPAGAEFGTAIAAAGATVVVGAPGEQFETGAAYVFQADLTIGWSTITLLAKLTAGDGGHSDGLGTSVAIKGRIVAVGAPCHDDVVDSPCVGLSGLHTYGALYVYREPFTGWVTTTQLAELQASSPQVFEQLGAAVAITDDGIYGGAPGFNKVYRFVQPAGGWTDTTEASVEFQQSKTHFGKALAGSGHTLAIADSSGAHGGSVTVEVTDDTAPTTAIQVDPESPDGGGDWYVTAPTLTVSAQDFGTGVAAIRCVLDPASTPATYDDLPSGCAYTGAGNQVSSDGTHTLYAASIDVAGNESDLVSASVSVDAAPPATSIVRTPASPDGSNGWYRSAVTAVVSATDAGSGVASTRCALDPIVTPLAFADLDAGCAYGGGGGSISGDGTHMLYAASIDNGGTAESIQSQSVQIDGTDPELSCRTASFVLGGTGSVTADVTDATSGPATATSTAPADTSSVGSRTASVTGDDVAGNEASADCSYVVGYNVLGPSGLRSSYKRGSVVPVKLALANAAGVRISDPSAAALAAACDVRLALAGGAWTCATYDAKAHQFTAAVRISRSGPAGLSTLVVEVLAGTLTVNRLEVPVHLN